MRILIGLFWAIGGAVLGAVAGALAAMLIIAVTNASNRDGAHGYFMVALGLVGAIAGLVAGLVLYGRSAPAGAGTAYFGSGLIGLVCLVAAGGLWLWAYVYLQERPLTYDGQTQADLVLELRVETANEPANARWFDVEMQTLTTRPTGYVYWEKRRTEAAHAVYLVTQGPMERAGNRVIIVNIPGKHLESFRPPIKRVPDPKAGWSEWYRPVSVDPPYGVVPDVPPKAVFELRYRVHRWGDDETSVTFPDPGLTPAQQ